jgi:hypothetical protein
MELRIEGNEIKVKGDKRIHEDAHKHPGRYGTEDDRTPWEYSANIVYKSLKPASFSSMFYSSFINKVLSFLDSGRIRGEGQVSLVTRGEFVNLIREKVTKETIDLYNQAYYPVDTHYLIKRMQRIAPRQDNSLIVAIGLYGNDPQTFIGEIMHKNGEKPHLLPPNRFPHIIDDTIEYLIGFHDKGEGPVYFHNRLTGDPKNEQRGILFGRIIDLFNMGRYLIAH